MDNIEFAKQNLGKKVIVDDPYFIGIIIGYDEESIIIGLIDHCAGWHDLDDNDIILVHSPIFESYWYVEQDEITIIE